MGVPVTVKSFPILTCACGEWIIRSVGCVHKLSSKAVIVRGTGTFAVCHRCDAEVQVPLRYDHELAKCQATKSLPVEVEADAAPAGAGPPIVVVR